MSNLDDDTSCVPYSKREQEVFERGIELGKKMAAGAINQQGEPVAEVSAEKGFTYGGRPTLPVGTKLYTSAPTIPAGWQPIETAPGDVPVVVGWLEAEDTDHPERYDFDQKEDGVWVRHEDALQHAQSCAPPGSRMPSEKAPYTCWMPLPAITKHKGDQS